MRKTRGRTRSTRRRTARGPIQSVGAIVQRQRTGFNLCQTMTRYSMNTDIFAYVQNVDRNAQCKVQARMERRMTIQHSTHANVRCPCCFQTRCAGTADPSVRGLQTWWLPLLALPLKSKYNGSHKEVPRTSGAAIKALKKINTPAPTHHHTSSTSISFPFITIAVTTIHHHTAGPRCGSI